MLDTDPSVNILPLAVLSAAGILMSKVVKSQISINGFQNSSDETMGYIEIDLRIGLVRSFTKFFVMDINVAYQALLRRPWINKHILVASTYHQCVKGMIGLRPIRILRNQMPFNLDEVHYFNVEF